MNSTRRHPRTMQEAWGPYTSHDLQPMRDPRDYSVWWWIVMAIVAGLTAAIIFATR